MLIHDHGVGELADDETADLYADAVRYGLVLIREAASGFSPAVGRADPRIRWGEVAGLADGLSDAVLLSSRDGLTCDRTFRQAFLRPGPDPAPQASSCSAAP